MSVWLHDQEEEEEEEEGERKEVMHAGGVSVSKTVHDVLLRRVETRVQMVVFLGQGHPTDAICTRPLPLALNRTSIASNTSNLTHKADT